MSTQARCFNIALVCSLHKVVTKHSLCDTEFYLLCKNVHNHTTETTLKKFCFAAIAFRIATGLNLKIDINTRGIKDLLYIDKDKCRNATTFLDNLSSSFQKAFVNNALNVQGCPGTCNNNSPNERFPLLTTQQKQDMFHRCNQLWCMFETAW